MFTLENYALEMVLGLLNAGLIRLDLPIQRKNRWDKKRKVLFIHSILCSMLPFNIILIAINKFLYVCDGKQRINAVISYKNNEFYINKHLFVNYIDSNTGENVSYDLYRKFYKDLPMELKYRFNQTNVISYNYRDVSNDIIVEIFSRINNGAPLNAQEGYRTAIFKKNPKFLEKIEKICRKYSTFFELFISEKSNNASDDLMIVLRLLCLIRNEKDLSNGSICRSIENMTLDDIKQIDNMISKIVSCKVFKDKIPEIGTNKLLQYIIHASIYAYNITDYCKCIVEFFSSKYDAQRENIFFKFEKHSTTSSKAVSERKVIFYEIAVHSGTGMIYGDMFDSLIILFSKKANNTNININIDNSNKVSVQ